ncbi:transposase [Streptomyces sp. IMTB 2501]
MGVHCVQQRLRRPVIRLWALIAPLLPPWPEEAPGPRPVPDRLCLEGIL